MVKVDLNWGPEGSGFYRRISFLALLRKACTVAQQPWLTPLVSLPPNRKFIARDLSCAIDKLLTRLLTPL